jgi:hypothetical protein
VKWYGKEGRKASRIAIRYGKYRRKLWNDMKNMKSSQIVKIYEHYGRNPSWIVKRNGKYGRKVSWILKWFGKYGRKNRKDMKNKEENSEKIWKI